MKLFTMRRVLIILIFMCPVITLSAQYVTESYLNKTPELPGDPCDITLAQVENFTSQVSILSGQVDNAIGEMKRNAGQSAKANEAAYKDQAMKQMAQMGVSQEEMAKMESGKMTAAEKQALANKMMMQQTNVSIDEMKAVQGMSDAGKRAYSEALATEMMVAGQTGQVKTSLISNPARLSALIQEQQQTMARISSRSQSLSGLYIAVENDPEGHQMLKRIETWSSKYSLMIGIDAGQGKQMDSLQTLIRKEQIRYCNKLTPQYHNALRAHLTVIKASLPDYRRLAEVSGQIAEAQTGVPSPTGENDITGMESMKEYLNRLQNAYMYKLYYPEKN
jgi:hypothetical protein